MGVSSVGDQDVDAFCFSINLFDPIGNRHVVGHVHRQFSNVFVGKVGHGSDGARRGVNNESFGDEAIAP